MGAAKAGSSGSTLVWPIRHPAGLPGAAPRSARTSQYPIIPWVCAPSTSSEYGRVSAGSLALSRASRPTCGPLPWVTMRSWARASGASAVGRLLDVVLLDVLIGLLAPLQQGVAAQRRDDSHGPSPIVATIRALIVCIRFSAWSKTTEAGDSKTSSVTSSASSPRLA